MDVGMLLVGRYRLEQPIGAGGMGQVWAAHDTRLGRDVAVKVQKFDPDGDRAAFERFRREAQSTAALQHPNVVTIFDSGTEGDTAFLVMELLPGPTLEAYVAERGPLSEQKVVALAAEVASGLAAAHRAGVVHRDIKPTNLMFDDRGTLKIVDFGIARLAQTTAARLTATNNVIGSASYLSPEQLTGRPADERSDLYALGCVMTTMLTGRPPFEGEHPLAVMNQHVNTAPPQISQSRPGIDPALEALVAQMLNKSAQDRPQSARAVLDRLRNIELGSPAENSEASLAATAVMGQPGPLPAPATKATAPAMPDRQRSGRGWWIAGVTALALVAVVLIAIATTAGDPPVNESASSGSVAPSAGPSREPASATSSTAATNSAEPSRESATSTSSAPQTTTTARTTTIGVQGALSELRAAVAAVSSSGQIDGKTAEELSKRVDELDKHLTEKGGEDSEDTEKSGENAEKHLNDMDEYLAELSEKGELTPDGERRIAAALQTVREQAAEG
jgi:serine/threonine-protein kinase